MPTLAGFQWFITTIMGINSTVLPTTDTVIAWVYGQAEATVNLQIAYAAPTIYEQAVYNLAGDMLINYAQDQIGQTFFSDLRASFHINDFVAGLVQSADDQSTSDSLEIPEALKQLTLADLQNLKTPYGRTYLALAQKVGSLWGIS